MIVLELTKKPTQSEELESEPLQEREPEKQREQPERERGKSIMRRMFDAMFGEDEFKEEREEMRSRRQQIDTDDDLQREPSIEKQQSEQSDNSLPMNVKKSYEPSSSSSSRRSSNRSVLLPVEEEALSEYINSSPPETVSKFSSKR